MKMSMYKGSGWFKESYRHYLAAKGIKTHYDYLAHKNEYFISKEERLKRKAAGLSNRGPKYTPPGTPSGMYRRTRPRQILSFEELTAKLAVAPVKRRELEEKYRAQGVPESEIAAKVDKEIEDRLKKLNAAKGVEKRVKEIDEIQDELEQEISNIQLADKSGLLKPLFGVREDVLKTTKEGDTKLYRVRVTLARLKKRAEELGEIETEKAQEESKSLLASIAKIEERMKKSSELQKERAELVKKGEKLAGVQEKSGVPIGLIEAQRLLNKEERGYIGRHPESKLKIVVPGTIEVYELKKHGMTPHDLKIMGSDATLKSPDPAGFSDPKLRAQAVQVRMAEKTMMLNKKMQILKRIERAKQRVASVRAGAIAAHAPPLSGKTVADIAKEAAELEKVGGRLKVTYQTPLREIGKDKATGKPIYAPVKIRSAILPTSVLKGIKDLSTRSRGKRLVREGRKELIKKGQKLGEKEMRLGPKTHKMKAAPEQRSGSVSTETLRTGISTQKETGKEIGFVLVEPRVHQQAPQNILKAKVSSKERVKREEHRRESARRAAPEYIERKKVRSKMLAKLRSERKSAEQEEEEIRAGIEEYSKLEAPKTVPEEKK